jgi:hypothetical protein
MTVGHSETELRQLFAARARELGAEPQPADFRLRYTEVPGLPECRLVAGTWRSGLSRNGITGLMCRGEDPDLLPGHAIVSVLHRWQAFQLPGPAVVASGVAFLLDPLEGRVPLLIEAQVRGWRALDGGSVATPSVETDPGSGRVTTVRFWWQEDAEAYEVVVDVDAEGRVAIGGDRSAVPDDAEGERP